MRGSDVSMRDVYAQCHVRITALLQVTVLYACVCVCVCAFVLCGVCMFVRVFVGISMCVVCTH